MKELYVMGQYSRFVRPESRRVESSSSDSGVKVTAFVNGANLSVVVINESSSSKTVEVNLAGLGNVSQVYGVRTSASENMNRLSSIPVINSKFIVTLSALSVTTLTTDLNLMP